MNSTSRKNKKNIIVVSCLAFVMIVVAAIFIGVKYREISTIRQGEFTFSLWDKYSGYRYYMIEDMEKRIDIWNLSQEEIIEKLGTNDMKVFLDNNNNTCLRYIIKRTRLFVFDFFNIEYYYIQFSNDGIVEDVYRWEGS